MMDYDRSETIERTNSIEKQPSRLGILILALVTITLYGLGIHESNKTVTDIIEAAVKETVIGDRF